MFKPFQFTGVSSTLLLRVASLPIEKLNWLSGDAIESTLERIRTAERLIDIEAGNISALLFSVVGTMELPEHRRAALRVRRSLFSKRRPTRDDLSALLAVAPKRASEDVSAFIAELDKLDQLAETLSSLVNEGLSSCTENIANSLALPSFYAGLLASSRSLLDAAEKVHRLQRSGPLRSPSQLERGLIRYLTRATFKATPFGQFCMLGAALPQLSAEGPPEVYIPSGAMPTSLLRLNKAVYGQIWELARRSDRLNRKLPLEVNPTLTESSVGQTFISFASGRELIQKLRPNAVTKIVLGILQQNPNCSIDKLTNLLLRTEYFDADESEMTTYLTGLLENGLLRLRPPVRAQDPEWALSLGDYFRAIDSELAQRLSDRLLAAHAAFETVRSQPVHNRVDGIDRLRTELEGALSELEPKTRLVEAPLFFEDWGFRETLQIRLGESVSHASRTLEALARRLVLIGQSRASMFTMRAFFDARYVGRDEPVPLVEFFETFYREHLKEKIAEESRLERGERNKGDMNRFNNPFNRPEIDQISKVIRHCGIVLLHACKQRRTTDEVHVSLNELLPAEHLPAPSVTTPMSVSAFAQACSSQREGPTRLFVQNGQLYLGFGKYFSRFLDAVSTDLTDEVRTSNARWEHTLMDLGADGNFNANLHPKIVDSSLAYPSPTQPIEVDAIDPRRLVVCASEKDAGTLEIRDIDSNASITPLDLGFLNPRMRPALYRLLMQFAPFSGWSLPIPSHEQIAYDSSATTIEKSEDINNRVLYRPRIVIDDGVVVARRSWKLINPIVLAQKDRESAHQYMLRLSTWRAEAGIPRQAYVRLVQRNATHSLLRTPGQKSQYEVSQDLPSTTGQGVPHHSARPERIRVIPRVKRDHHKPQFIDFASPVLVDLFSRIIAGSGSLSLMLEEVYPAFEHWLRIGEDFHASEMILQYDLQSEGPS